MKTSVLHSAGQANNRRGESAQSKTVVLVALFLAAGFAAGVIWHQHRTGGDSASGNQSSTDTQSAGLSPTTITVLKRLDTPVEVRFYSLLDPGSAADSLKSFAQHVDQLLSAYQDASNGKLKVVRHTSQADDSSAAFADGLTPFNLDKGDACYLGVAVSLGSQKETLPRLAPEWEQAVEPDLTRAIARLIDARQPGATTVATVAPPDMAVIAAVKSTIPDVTATSLEDGKKLLQAAALQEFATAAAELNNQMKDAQQRLSQAQAGGSDAEQQAAMKNLQDIQAAQSAKLQQISARSRAEVEAFKQMKVPAK